MNLSGRTALVTGGASGIGLTLASALLAKQNTVIAAGRSAAKLEAAKRQHPGLQTIVCDLTKGSDMQSLVDRVAKDFPNLDLLFNNAGMMETWNPAEDAWHESLDLEIQTNLTAPMKLITALLPTLRKRPNAAIVNITSALVYAPIAMIPVYCATKAALHSYTKSLRFQLKGTPIQVIELLPSTVATDMSTHRFTSKMLTPEAVVGALLSGMEKDRVEIRVGQAVPLYVMTRLAPALIEPTILGTRTERMSAGPPAKA